jgi:UPF0042 nucleotide-binding protein
MPSQSDAFETAAAGGAAATGRQAAAGRKAATSRQASAGRLAAAGSAGEVGIRSRPPRHGRPAGKAGAGGHESEPPASRGDVVTGPASAEQGNENEQRVVILSGLSGAGKTAATKLFEDLGYTCMDNVPGELLPDLAELVSTDRRRFEKVAIVLDVRAGNAPLALAAMRGALEGRGIKPRVIFLEARDDVLIRRFSETRHRHPLAGRRGIAGSIAEERRRLEPIRADSDIVVDTSDLSLRQLKERIFSHLTDAASEQGLVFQLISFGFKYGVPLEADLVFDVRFMENPYYVDELRHLSGLTPAVRDYVMGQPIAQQFFDFLSRFLDLTVPGFKSEGKTRLTIAIGCTGGYHRSIVITEELRSWLERRGFGTVAVFHRELERE